MVTEKAHTGFVGRGERPIGDDLDLAEVLNFTRVLVLPDLGLAHLNILWNHVDQIEKLLAIVSFGHDNASLRLWISQVVLSLGVRSIADSVNGTDLEEEVCIVLRQIQVVVSVKYFWQSHRSDLILRCLHLSRIAHRVGAPVHVPAI